MDKIQQLHKFSGGIISGKTLANLDSQSEGPERVAPLLLKK